MFGPGRRSPCGRVAGDRRGDVRSASPPSGLAQHVNDAYDDAGGELCGRNGEPQPRNADPPGQQQKARHEEQHAPQQGVCGRDRGFFDALVVPDERDVDREEHGAEREERQPLDRQSVGRLLRIEEEPHDRRRTQPQAAGHRDAAHDGREERDVQRPADPLREAGAVVEADDRLCRLGDGVADRKYDREKIARDGEGRDALLVEQRDEHVVAREHHHAHGQFGQEGGESDPDHVGRVAQGQQQRGQRAFQPIEPQLVREPEEVEQDHHAADGTGDRRGQRRTHDAPAQRKHHVPVERDVDDGRRDLHRHGVFRRAVQADQHHAHAFDEEERQTREQPEQVVERLGFEPRAAPQQVKELAGEGEAAGADQSDEQQPHDECLRRDDAGGLRVVLRQPDARHDRGADAEHQADAGGDHENGGGDVHRRDAVGPDAPAHEDAVDDGQGRVEDHPDERRKEQGAEERSDFVFREIDAVSREI